VGKINNLPVMLSFVPHHQPITGVLIILKLQKVIKQKGGEKEKKL